MTQPSILIVGATGRLGSRLIRQLAAAGVKPRALVRSRDKGEAVAALATPVLGDLMAPETLTGAFRGAERVFIVAPPTPEMETLERNAIDAAAAAGARRVVYLSNFAATEGDADLHVHVHGLHQRYVATLGIDWTVLRPTRYMSYFPFVWRSVLDYGLLLEAGGSGAMSVIDPDDVAAIAVKALMEDGYAGQTYKLTSEDAYTAGDLAALLSRVLGREIKAFVGDAEAFREALITKGGWSGYPPAMARYFAKVAAGLYPTTNTAAKVLGRAPRAYADWLEHNLPAVYERS
jgi:uncharacterized protein YbjT (DUF2867 family)